MLLKKVIKGQIASLKKECALAEYTLRDVDIKIKALQDQCPHDWKIIERGAWDMPERICKICDKHETL